jgi:hypothetical protein
MPPVKGGATKTKRPREILPAGVLIFVELIFVGSGFFHFLGFGNLSGIGSAILLAFLFAELGAEQFENGKTGTVAESEADVNDASVASGAIGEARRDIREELLRGGGSHQESSGTTASGERVSLAECDHALDKRTRGLGASDGGLDALVFEYVGDEVAQSCPAMGRLATEFRT